MPRVPSDLAEEDEDLVGAGRRNGEVGAEAGVEEPGGEAHAAVVRWGKGAGGEAGGENLGDTESAIAVAVGDGDLVGALHGEVEEGVVTEQTEGYPVSGPGAQVERGAAAPAVVAGVQRDGEAAVGVEGDEVGQGVAVETAEGNIERLAPGRQDLVERRGDAQEHSFFQNIELRMCISPSRPGVMVGRAREPRLDTTGDPSMQRVHLVLLRGPESVFATLRREGGKGGTGVVGNRVRV